MKKKIGIINLVLMAAVFAGNYFYHTIGGLAIKSACSAGFALMGIVNLFYACKRRSGVKFAAGMAAGLILAMLGDILIGSSFIVGAGLFAAGHVCFFLAQNVLSPFRKLDGMIGGGLFIGAALFLLLHPGLSFPNPIIHGVCIVYALIISMMLGKAISNFILGKNRHRALLMIACALFFFSDLMLVFNWFMDTGRITSILCMATYYPAECLLAYSAYMQVESAG